MCGIRTVATRPAPSRTSASHDAAGAEHRNKPVAPARSSARTSALGRFSRSMPPRATLRTSRNRRSMPGRLVIVMARRDVLFVEP
jgi:hypothetical protein